MTSASLLHAADLPTAFVVNIPFQPDQTLPIWLGRPETPQTTFAMLEVPIAPPDPNASLLVTVYFQEKQGGFLRLAWQGPQTTQLLTDNFYEGIAMSNQRSLLIPAETMTGTGKLIFQCGDTNSVGIQRIKLEWLESKTSLGSAQSQDLLVTPESGITQPSQEFDGQRKSPDPATWKSRVVTVPITDCPLRVEQGVEFAVQLDNLPLSGRLALKVDGLPLGKHLVVWINQQRAGEITPSVPDLYDAGYLAENPPDVYVGWREGSLFVPLEYLKVGSNTVQFSSECEAPPDPTATTTSSADAFVPIAVKNVVFQLSYAVVTPDITSSSPPPPLPALSSANSTLPSGPVAPPPPSPSTASVSDFLLPGPGEMSPRPALTSDNTTP